MPGPVRSYRPWLGMALWYKNASTGPHVAESTEKQQGYCSSVRSSSGEEQLYYYIAYLVYNIHKSDVSGITI